GLWILLIILAFYFLDRMLQYLLSKVRKQQTEFGDISIIAHFATQATGVLLVLAVIFGIPEQFPSAAFGVVGAGITVATKDLALGFIDRRVQRLVAKPA